MLYYSRISIYICYKYEIYSNNFLKIMILFLLLLTRNRQKLLLVPNGTSFVHRFP